MKGNKFTNWCGKHKTGIATAGGIVGFIASEVLVGIATFRSIRVNDAKEKELGRKTTKKEKVKILWKYWVAPLATTGGSAAAIIWSDKKQIKISSAALTACSIEKKNFEDYKQIVSETVDDKAKKSIDSKYEEKQIENIDMKPRKYEIGVPEGDQVYCYDPLFNTKFIASKNEIQDGVNRFNAEQSQFLSKGTVDDLYDYWNVSQQERPSIVREMGWDEGVLIEVRCTEAELIDGIPRMIIEYEIHPKGL